MRFTCERAPADGPREHARQIEHADPLEGILDVACSIGTITKQALGRVANLGDRYCVDVRLEYPMRRAVHNFERAQRGCTEVSLEGDRFKLLRGPFGQRGCYRGLGGLALQDVE